MHRAATKRQKKANGRMTTEKTIEKANGHHWKNLAFDAISPEDRAEFAESNPDAALPITHTNNAIMHARLCQLFRDGTLGDEPCSLFPSLIVALGDDETGRVEYSSLDDFVSLSETLLRQVQAMQPDAPTVSKPKRARATKKASRRR